MTQYGSTWGLFQHDVNVLWDLAVHDLAIMDFILGEQPGAVSATGVAHLKNQPEDVAYITCYLQNNLIGPISMSTGWRRLKSAAH